MKRFFLGIAMLANLGALGAFAQSNDHELGAGIRYEGWLDLYYAYNFNEPRANAAISNGIENNALFYNVKHNDFSVALLTAHLYKPVERDGDAGFRVTFAYGKTTDILHSPLQSLGDQSDYKNLFQAFVSYRFGGGFVADFGKFLSPIGYETMESFLNWNYSRSLLFSYVEPNYHTGLRVTTPSWNGFGAALYLVNGVNNVEDNNDPKMPLLVLSYAPNARLSLSANYFDSSESDANSRHRRNFNANATYNVNDRLTLALTGDVGEDESFSPTARWQGGGVYAKYNTSSRSYLAFRAIALDTDNGWLSTPATTDIDLSAYTLTYQHQLAEQLFARLEYEYQHASDDFFFDKNDDQTETSQQAVTFALGYRF